MNRYLRVVTRQQHLLSPKDQLDMVDMESFFLSFIVILLFCDISHFMVLLEIFRPRFITVRQTCAYDTGHLYHAV